MTSLASWARSKRVLLPVAVVMLSLLTGACSKAAAVDRIGLYYTGGMLQGQHFKKVVEPGSGATFLGWQDDIKFLPAGQRNYIVSSANDAPAGPEATVHLLVTVAGGLGRPSSVTTPTCAINPASRTSNRWAT